MREQTFDILRPTAWHHDSLTTLLTWRINSNGSNYMVQVKASLFGKLTTYSISRDMQAVGYRLLSHTCASHDIIQGQLIHRLTGVSEVVHLGRHWQGFQTRNEHIRQYTAQNTEIMHDISSLYRSSQKTVYSDNDNYSAFQLLSSACINIQNLQLRTKPVVRSNEWRFWLLIAIWHLPHF